MKINTSFLWLFTIALALTSCGLDETPSSVLTEVPEDRNLTISGGGKISWDSTNKQVSFTGNIVVRDHRTDKVTTITTAASPIPLTNENDVAYFERAIAPETNQTVEALEIAAGGTVPERTETSGPVVLFHRTDENTLWIPWVQREMLNGDFWQWGTQLSWYERITASHKPAYRNNGINEDDSQVAVPASPSSPAVVNIDGKLYANTSRTVMDLDTTGRGGLDTETKSANTAYYLYAIPATTGRTFDLVSSTTAPNDLSPGPTSFSSWSYLGSFATDNTLVEVDSFFASLGNFQNAGTYIASEQLTESTDATAKTIENCPTTATKVSGRLQISGTVSDRWGCIGGVEACTGFVRTQTDPTIIVYNDVETSLTTPATIYLNLQNGNNIVSFSLKGWQEDPMAYK